MVMVAKVRGARDTPPADDFDRDAFLAKLFALPVPPVEWRGRAFPIHTPLGRIMRLRELKIRDVTKYEGAPNERLMSDYLAGRAPIPARYKVALARGLGVDPRVL